MTVDAPARRHPYAIKVRAPEPEPTSVQIASPLPDWSLDRARLILADDHADHVNGPVFPCTLCFLPPYSHAR